MPSIPETKLAEIKGMCGQMRIDLIKLLHSIQTGHPGGSLSVCEILATLYFGIGNVDPSNPKWEGRDRIVLTKGHAAPMLYFMLAEKGFFAKEELKNLRQINSMLQGHPSIKTTPGVEVSTGPLGAGLSAAVGMAMSLKLDNNPALVYAIVGDGELNEGTIWEALMSASKFKLDNLITIVDLNGVQLDGTCEDIMPMGDIGVKFAAFGCEVLTCDGHDIADIFDTIEQAKAIQGKPVAILASTVKGKGVPFMEGKNAWHGAPIGKEHFDEAMRELGGTV